MADWSELPEDVITLFVERLPAFVEEFLRVSCVCKSWRLAALQAKRKVFAPWLMLSKLDNDSVQDGAMRDCYNVYSRNILSLQLPELGGRRCWGTPYGWLITLGLDLNITLSNPLTKTQFRLPPQPTFPVKETDAEDEDPEDDTEDLLPEEICRHFITKFALSSNPSESGESVVIMALHSGACELAFATPVHKAWTPLKCPFSANCDVTFFDGHFYSISVRGVLRLCDINCSEPEAIDIAQPPSGMCLVCSMYLVGLSGRLHLIVRRSVSVGRSYDYHQKTVAFEVYSFNFDRTEWVEVGDFHGHALFVGNNTSFGISTLDYPEFKSNAIYFTDDDSDIYSHNFCDMGVYDFGTQAVVENLQTTQDLLSKLSRPFFFMPSLG